MNQLMLGIPAGTWIISWLNGITISNRPSIRSVNSNFAAAIIRRKSFSKFLRFLSANQPSTFLEEHDNGDKFFIMMSIPLENLIDESTIQFEIDRFLQFLKGIDLPWAYDGQRFLALTYTRYLK